MGAFDYDGFLVKMLVKAANMMIVSFFWLISCIPVLTAIPATAALFHTTSKVIRQSGSGVMRSYFSALRGSLKKGIPLSLICIIFGLLLYTALDFGRQMWKTGIFWTLYYAFGFFLAFVFLTMLLFIPPSLSRFESSIGTTLRLSLYLASKNLLRSIWYMFLLGLMALIVYIYPITILILPGLYSDLICGGMEKALSAFMKERGLTDEKETPEAQSVSEGSDDLGPEPAEVSSLELAKLLDEDEPDKDNSDSGEADE